MTSVIAFTGEKGSGKDTAFKAIEAPGIKNIKFADALKDMVRVLLQMRMVDSNTIYRMLEGDLKEIPSPALDGRTPRHVMQTLGTEWGRDMIHPDLWINTAKARIKYHVNQGRRVVVTDARFPNEVAMLQEAFSARVINISRDSDSAGSDSHVSETGIKSLPFDVKLLNNGSVEEFADKVRREVFQTVWKTK